MKAFRKMENKLGLSWAKLSTAGAKISLVLIGWVLYVEVDSNLCPTVVGLGLGLELSLAISCTFVVKAIDSKFIVKSA